jgi:hypothetical protein
MDQAMTGDQYPWVMAGYQDTSKGRRLAPRACWSDAAWQRALGIPEWLASPTVAQRVIGITDFDENGAAIYGAWACTLIPCPPIIEIDVTVEE